MTSNIQKGAALFVAFTIIFSPLVASATPNPIVIPILLPPIDLCSNIDGIQASIPDGMILVDGNCTTPAPVIIDVCPNIADAQASVPEGMVINSDGNCVTPPSDNHDGNNSDNGHHDSHGGDDHGHGGNGDHNDCDNNHSDCDNGHGGHGGHDDNSTPTATLTVVEVVVGGSAQVSDFPLTVDGMTVTSGVATTTSVGAHVVSNGAASSTYPVTFSGDCVGGNVTLAATDAKTCTITNTYTAPVVVVPPTHTSQTIVVRASDLDTNSTAVALTDGLSKWFMYNDTNDTIDNTLGSFVTGPTGILSGTGSVEFTLGASPMDRKNIATFQFSGTTLASIVNLSYYSYSHSGVAGVTEAPYLNFNVDFTGTSGAFQKRLAYVPANNGAVPQDTWNYNDALQSGNAKWVYSGATWPAPNAATPGTTPLTWTKILTDYPNARILPVGGWVGVRVGEPGPTNYTADVDTFVMGTISGNNVNTVTYDFEPAAPVTLPAPTVTTTSGGNGGGGGGGGVILSGPLSIGFVNTNSGGGLVLGTSTDSGSSCGPLLTHYLRIGHKNDSSDVTKLQNFLNSYENAGLKVTGMFDITTEAAVKNFQLSKWQDVLAPWVPFGLAGDHAATGYVFKTTLRAINMANCSTLSIPAPQLP